MRHRENSARFFDISFQSTHPVWDATSLKPCHNVAYTFQSTHPVWDATMTQFGSPMSMFYFNPRIPYGMRRVEWHTVSGARIFQSTHPVWDATKRIQWRILKCYFNPRIPYGMRHATITPNGVLTDFNPRIPYGMRLAPRWTGLSDNVFQSTHPVWDATVPWDMGYRDIVISIHASRMGCDDLSSAHQPKATDFNPRIPYGMRPGPQHRFRQQCYFNPRIPYGMRPARRPGIDISRHISIHASRMGCDAHRGHGDRMNIQISIHASRMGCDDFVRPQRHVCHISIHASRMGCDGRHRVHKLHDGISIHASRMGCDTENHVRGRQRFYFNPRIPYGMRHAFKTPYDLWLEFQSTHPVWDATARMDIAFHNMEIFARSSS